MKYFRHCNKITWTKMQVISTKALIIFIAIFYFNIVNANDLMNIEQLIDDNIDESEFSNIDNVKHVDNIVSDVISSSDSNEEDYFKDTVELQAINKITAKVSKINVPVNSNVQFGNLLITTELCWQSPPDQRPENKALLLIRERKPYDKEIKNIFYGWMFSSNPSVSVLEHPVYDIVLLECKNMYNIKK